MAEEIQDLDLNEDEKQLLRELLSGDEQHLTEFGKQRRHFIKQLLGTGGALLTWQLLGEQSVFAEVSEFSLDNSPAENIENGVAIHFKVNGLSKSLKVDSRMTLLDTLRERLRSWTMWCLYNHCGW